MNEAIPDSPAPSNPADGWELMCEGILRTEFGRRSCDALANAMAQLAAEGANELEGNALRDEAGDPALPLLRGDPAAVVAPHAIGEAKPGRERTEPRWLEGVLRRFRWCEIQIAMRWALAAAALCLTWLGLYIYFESTPAARLAEVQGQVTVERHAKKLKARSGQRLYPRDLLRVPAGGAAVLAWNVEETRVALEAGTEFKLLGQVRGKKLMLLHGKMQGAVAPQSRNRPMVVSTPQAEASVVGTHFSLEATAAATRLDVAEGAVALRKKRLASTSDQVKVTVNAGQFAIASPTSRMEAQFITGYATPEVLAFPAGTALFETAGGTIIWSGFVSNLMSFPGSARMEATSAKRYEQRIRCYISPPATGDYTFWIHSGKRSELWLSSDDHPGEPNKIASMPLSPKPDLNPVDRTGVFQVQIAPATSIDAAGAASRGTVIWNGNFNAYPSQKSAPQHLVAGDRYYLEIRHELDPRELINPVMVEWAKVGDPAQGPNELPSGSALAPSFEIGRRAEVMRHP